MGEGLAGGRVVEWKGKAGESQRDGMGIYLRACMRVCLCVYVSFSWSDRHFVSYLVRLVIEK